MGTDYLGDDPLRQAQVLAQRKYRASGRAGGLIGGYSEELLNRMSGLHDHYFRDRGTPIAVKKALTAREELQEETDNFLKF